eukprot:Skav218371  [mRNA]  locus=scaffold2066:203221:205579:- [translate_table: standard]
MTFKAFPSFSAPTNFRSIAAHAPADTDLPCIVFGRAVRRKSCVWRSWKLRRNSGRNCSKGTSDNCRSCSSSMTGWHRVAQCRFGKNLSKFSRTSLAACDRLLSAPSGGVLRSEDSKYSSGVSRRPSSSTSSKRKSRKSHRRAGLLASCPCST